MQAATVPVVIGSRSPRRLELLGWLFPSDRLRVCPPRDGNEAGFDRLTVLEDFERRILEIVAVKQADVIGQLRSDGLLLPCAVVSADTTVIVAGDSHGWLSLGQPPEGDDYSPTVRHWFQRYLAGRTHVVMSGLSIAIVAADGVIQQQRSRVCQTRVTMRSDVDAWLDWYIASGEPRGKAGGYAVQGAGSVFVTAVEGSFSNVVGLPLEDALDMFRELKVLPS